MDLKVLQTTLREFAAEREFGERQQPFHTPKNQAMALMVEAAELAEIFQWMTPEQSQAARGDLVLQEQVADEVADVLLYLVQIADYTGIDLKRAVGRKLVKNSKKRPPLRPGLPGFRVGTGAAGDTETHVLVDWENVQPKDDDIRSLVPDRLSFYMGYIAARHPDARSVVVSNDKGYAGPLTAKLGKKYREREHVKGRPLLLAIQDFHAPMSMLSSRTALPIYLYGRVWDWEKLADGKLVITPKQVEQHVRGAKSIASGFFGLPGSENISAVVANASATISKFNRMGVLAGFGSKRVRLVRKGTAANPAPNSELPAVFVHDVNAPDYSETWIEGMDVFHNPNAAVPLHPAALPGAAHHWVRGDGQLESRVPAWQPFASTTQIFVPE